MSPIVRLVVVVLLFTLPAACGTAVTSARCVGDTCEPTSVDADDTAPGDEGDGTDRADAAENDVGTDPDADDAAVDADEVTEDTVGPVRCDDAERNACGGCGPLLVNPGDPCGPCLDGVWECQGTDATRCDGAVLDPRDWWRDGDGDGFGDDDSLPYSACEPPAPSWVDNDGDCRDGAPDVHRGATEVCDGRDQDCDGLVDEPPDGFVCDDACCDDGFTCEDGTCLPRCDGTRCGSAGELCCDDASLCYADACATVGDLCAFTEECGIDELCEPSYGVCLPRSVVPACEYRPPVGEFDPRLACRWTAAGMTVNPLHGDVVATPIVVNLTDDDGNGATDENDTPDIVFLTYDLDVACCNTPATLRIVSGQCNPDGTMRTIASLAAPVLTNDSGVAAGDLDGDGIPEVVAVTREGGNPSGTVAFTRVTDDGSEWRVLWHNTTYPRWDVHTRGGAIVSLTNLDAAGGTEVVIGNVVLDGATGALLWDGVADHPGPVGIGNNAFLGPSSAVGDVDLDGRMEVIAGNTLYEHDGAVAWTYTYTTSNSTCQGSLPCDGFNAIGNFDDDPYGELVAIRLGEAFVWNHDGTLLWQAQIPSIDCSRNESGPPTIADFDGDGFPEIGTASADYYVVLDMNDCDTPDYAAAGCSDRNILWKVTNQDCSSRATGSSVFDFEGDGRAEVVYADETSFRIFDGRTGDVLFDDPTHGSHTRIEMPVIADVDNDGNAEIMVPENGSNSGRPGVDVWEDAADNWVRTRRVWNQHGYSVTNIEEDGEIPVAAERNWRNPRLNNYRQNTQPAGLFDAPDLAVVALGVEAGSCPLSDFRVRVVVSNEGALAVPPGMVIEVVIEAAGGVVRTDRLVTLTRLLPGDSETLVLDAPIVGDVPAPPYVVSATIDPDEAVNECDDSNNTRESVPFDCYPFP